MSVRLLPWHQALVLAPLQRDGEGLKPPATSRLEWKSSQADGFLGSRVDFLFNFIEE